MKKTIFLLLFIFLASCSKDTATETPPDTLPPETTTGANTFGVTINGKVYTPRDPTGWSTNPSTKGLSFWGSPDNVSWNELKVKDGASAVGFNIYLHMQDFINMNIGRYSLEQSNFQNQSDSISATHIYFIIWDNNISNYAYYGSIVNQGEINITRHSGGIVSGNFKGKFVRYDNPNDFITITDGRFDINTFTLSNTPFP